ncbi:TauD/TfdA family dioxygenase [Streptomyces sp. NPDC001914]|uniref:TauD/TfdA family dioxygenase n=1 Tax=Streptomyces sp. NPDC001914 TaxID=3364623 RepID=UPI00367B5400
MTQLIAMDPIDLTEQDSAGAGTDLVAGRLATYGWAYVGSVPRGFDYVGFLGQFGDLLPQYRGEKVWDLKPEPDMDDVYHSNNTRALTPHTEGYELSGLPPRYVALWCVTPSSGPGGETTLADGYEMLDGLTEQDRESLRERRYEWHCSEGLARQGVHLSNSHPVLESHAGVDVMRYSYNNVARVPDGLLIPFLEAGKEFFDREHSSVLMAQDALLIWDNWRMMHSRNAFTDRGRHFRRVLIGA